MVYSHGWQVGGWPQFPSKCTSSQGCLNILLAWWLTSPRESDLKEQDRSCHWQSPLTIPRKYKQNLGNKKTNLSIPFVFTRVSLSSRVPHAEALQLALQTRVPWEMAAPDASAWWVTCRSTPTPPATLPFKMAVAGRVQRCCSQQCNLEPRMAQLRLTHKSSGPTLCWRESYKAALLMAFWRERVLQSEN